ncbi:putative membrane protein [Parapedobacter composti]|uniref:Putative membrane protein n=2 Tax=Parapedobacter composti TaxID=623281 RepID=A0A1I1IGW1_9SPHI|nr:putative membrane protein [Parapedobacter composti]
MFMTMEKRMRMNVVWLMLPCAVFTMSCNDDDGNGRERMQNQEFVTMAASSNRFEIEAGELASEQGADERVIAFGNHMVMDHGAAATQLTVLATAKGWNIPDDMLEREREMLEELMTLEGAAFDRAFARMMVTSHEQAVALFERASGQDGVFDDDLRAWAAGKLPTLREHLEEARELDEQINP